MINFELILFLIGVLAASSFFALIIASVVVNKIEKRMIMVIAKYIQRYGVLEEKDERTKKESSK